MSTMHHDRLPAPAPPVPGSTPSVRHTARDSDQTTAGFAPADHVLVRFNLQPATALEPGSDTASAPAWRGSVAAAYDAVSQRLALEPAVSAELYHLGGRVDDDVRRRVVLPVRRAVHQGRRPDAEAVGALLELAALPYLQAWLELDEAVSRALHALEAGHTDRLAAERAALRQLLADPEVQRSFAVASPDMLRASVGYAESPDPTRSSKSLRKSEPTLLKHGLRAMLKTSPFSRYTATALGWRAPDLPAVSTVSGRRRSLPLPVAEVGSSVEPSHLLARRLLRAAHRDPRLRPHVPVQLAPHLVREDDRLRFQAEVAEDAAAARVDASSQQDVGLPAAPALLALCDLVEQHGPLTPERLTARLVEAGAPADTAPALVARLLEVGLLVPAKTVPAQSEDVLGETADSLAATGTVLGEDLASGLRALRTPIAEYASATGPARVSLARQVDEAWQRLYTEVDATRPAGTLLYEDASLSREIEVPEPLVDSPALSRVAALMTLFDDHCLLRRLVRQAVVEQAGVGGTVEDVVDFAPAMADTLRRSWDLSTRTVSADGESSVGEGAGGVEGTDDLGTDVTALLTLRSRILLDIAEHLSPETGEHPAAGPLSDVHDVVLDADLDRWLDAAPASLVARPTSYDLFVQPDAASRLTYVNKVYGGWSQFTSRFLRYFGEPARARIAASLRAGFEDDVRLLQLRPVLGFNANLHPLVFDGDLDVDDRVGTLPEGDARIEDLRLRHDLATDEVVVEERATGRRVEVFYLGFLVPYLLPYHQSLFYVLNGCGQVYFRPFRETEQVRRQREPDGVRAYPRVRVGDVVLVRRRWYLDRDQVPVPRGDEDDAAYFVRVQGWRSTHGLPAQVFLLPDDAAEADGMIPFLKSVTRVKPAPIDLSSPLQVRSMRRWLADADPVVVLEEAAPTADGGLVTDHADPTHAAHATELVVELTRSETAAR